MSNNVRSAIAAEVRAEMARQRKTQRDLSAALGGMDPAAVSRRVRGERPFLAEELVMVAEAWDVSPARFLAAAA
jgi:transcriptional regulator with XRE-family HTH domain